MNPSSVEGHPINTALAFFVIVKKEARRQKRRKRSDGGDRMHFVLKNERQIPPDFISNIPPKVIGSINGQLLYQFYLNNLIPGLELLYERELKMPIRFE